jgi:hypothetical protein
MDLEEYNYTMGSKSSFGHQELDKYASSLREIKLQNFMEKTLSFIF